ncbi:Hsp20/alpha crystallin family protein [Streptomyces sp. DH10]|uniref:Hsp20/alpha crystallin family protein n=1 Tax=Streptomyces sp. DH10 TaxID=3040121 RepID=UPI002440FB61|nr:Hsp20 family protein [Streptomyces sp. DH10]MDG9709575.1 Hsp20 family protein [Streptomyces sp. DH10]
MPTPQVECGETLPQDTDEEHVTAELADGVLTVTVPKAEKAKPGTSRSPADPAPSAARPSGRARLVGYAPGAQQYLAAIDLFQQRPGRDQSALPMSWCPADSSFRSLVAAARVSRTCGHRRRR